VAAPKKRFLAGSRPSNIGAVRIDFADLHNCDGVRRHHLNAADIEEGFVDVASGRMAAAAICS
jgi:hypothetical protein